MTQNYTILLIAVIIVTSLLVLVLFIINKRKKSASLQMAEILTPYIQDEIKDIIIPDGIGGLLEIEHLVLIDQGLLLIETYPISGNLFGAETIDQWTQIIDGRSYKFSNPLRHIRTSRQALKVLAPNVSIYCRIVFNADSMFPKGKPEEVSVLSSLNDDLTQELMDIQPTTLMKEQSLNSWKLIMRIARKNGQAVKREGGSDGG